MPHAQGVYLDADVLLTRPLDELLASATLTPHGARMHMPHATRRMHMLLASATLTPFAAFPFGRLADPRAAAHAAAFPFERLADPRAHPTLVDRLGFGGLVGQYAFAASPAHPFLKRILGDLRRAAAEPSWAQVPLPPAPYAPYAPCPPCPMHMRMTASRHLAARRFLTTLATIRS